MTKKPILEKRARTCNRVASTALNHEMEQGGYNSVEVSHCVVPTGSMTSSRRNHRPVWTWELRYL